MVARSQHRKPSGRAFRLPNAGARPAPSSARPARVARTPRLPASGRSSTPGRAAAAETHGRTPDLAADKALRPREHSHAPRPVPAEFLGRPGAWEC